MSGNPLTPWRSDRAADGSLHCLGNGQFCVYEQGPEIVQVFGPPYSVPSLGQIRLEPRRQLECQSAHEPGGPIWRHTLGLDGEPLGELVDFVDSKLSCLVRQLYLKQTLSFALSLDVPARLTFNSLPGAAGGALFEVPAGVYFFHEYPTLLPNFYQLAWQSAVQVVNRESSGLGITCPAGESLLLLAGGPAYPQAIESATQALAAGCQELLTATRQHWLAWAAPQAQVIAQIPEVPNRAEIIQAVGDTALLLKTQQAAQGAVLAGHNYHWAGVRDQYGVSRGLLALGHMRDAQQILEFYWQTWQRHGRLHNGLGIGVEAFHVHENDRVEITGYLLLQAFDLLEAGGDLAFLEKIFPMLEWAFQSQVAELVEGMLPFNGDETYVAGGILPRSALNDGSAEATLLFLEGGAKLLQWAERHAAWSAAQTEQARLAITDTRKRYRKNFWRDGKLLTNQPRRAELATLPRFRHGVCERCLVEPARPVGAIWTERSASGRYLCPDCLAKGDFPAARPQAYQLNSISLAPLYFRSTFFSQAELAPAARASLANYHQLGYLPCRPEQLDGLAVGYDYGLLLYALATMEIAEAGDFAQAVLALRDRRGAWAEYYRRNQPVGTRCRPWESAINLEALLKWATAGAPE